MPVPDALVPAFETIWSVLSQLTPVEPDKVDLLQPLTRYLRDRGSRASGSTLPVLSPLPASLLAARSMRPRRTTCC